MPAITLQRNILGMKSIHVMCTLLTTMNLLFSYQFKYSKQCRKTFVFQMWYWLKIIEEVSYILNTSIDVNGECFFPKETILLSLLWEMTTSIPFLCRTNKGQVYPIIIDSHKFPNKPTWGNLSTSISLLRALCAQLKEIFTLSVMSFS